jgi:hypothetical protein
MDKLGTDYPTQAKVRLDPDFLYAALNNDGVCGFQ